MIKLLRSILNIIARYQLVLVFVMLGLGFLFSDTFRVLNPFNTLFLQIIMFATGLRLDLVEFVRELKDWRTLLLSNVMMLIVIPFLVNIPLALFAPDWSLPFILAAAMPTGLTTPAIISILGGRTSLALLVAVSTSLMAPFTIPVILKVLVGQSVQIQTLDMMLNIGLVAVVPLVLAGLVQWLVGKKRIDKADLSIRLLNVTAFALVIASVTASSIHIDVEGRGMGFFGISQIGLITVALMAVFYLGVAWLSTSLLAWRHAKDRVTVCFCLIYMNYTLAIWLADKYFAEYHAAPRVVAIMVLTLLMIPLFKYLLPKAERKGYHKRIFETELTA